MQNELTFRPTPLEKCLLGITLPLTKEKFFRELHEDSPKDFAKTYPRTAPGLNKQIYWEKHETLVNLIDEVSCEVEKLGVHVITDFSIGHMKSIKDYDVVTILGHWVNHSNRIELPDDIYSPNDFMNAIPNGTHCMLDLTVCESVILLKEIKKRFLGDIIVFGFTVPITARYWLFVYQSVIREMKRCSSLNYLDATALVRKRIIEHF